MDETNDKEERHRARQHAAERRVLAALRSIEEAQALFEQATQALCSVKGMVGEWHKVGALHDRARDVWYAVDKRAKALSRREWLVLDHDPDEHEARWQALLEGSEEA
jgi:hypothetical protein